MKIIIECPLHKGSNAELWEIHKKISLFLKKKNLSALKLYTPSSSENSMIFDLKSIERSDLIINEIKSLLASRTNWKLKIES